MIDTIILFFILTPGILFRFPFKKYTSAMLHGVLFTFLLYFSHRYLEGNDNLVLESIFKDSIIRNPKDKNLGASLIAVKYN